MTVQNSSVLRFICSGMWCHVAGQGATDIWKVCSTFSGSISLRWKPTQNKKRVLHRWVVDGWSEWQANRGRCWERPCSTGTILPLSLLLLTPTWHLLHCRRTDLVICTFDNIAAATYANTSTWGQPVCSFCYRVIWRVRWCDKRHIFFATMKCSWQK